MVNRNSADAGIYIDVENLTGNIEIAQNILAYMLRNWPANLPQLKKIALYARERATMWESSVKGIARNLQGPWPFANHDPEITSFITAAYSYVPQKPSDEKPKNLADIKIAMDVCQDVLSGQVGYVAILSNDSDYFLVHEKLKEFQETTPPICSVNLFSGRGVPFMHIFHPGSARISPSMMLVPKDNRWHLPEESMSLHFTVDEEDIVQAIVQKEDDVFGYSEIEKVIQGDDELRRHPAATYQGEALHNFVDESLWPLMQNYGVARIRPGRYVVTEAAKSPVAPPSEESKEIPVVPATEQEEEVPVDSPTDQEVIDAFVKDWIDKGRSGGGFRAYIFLAFITQTWPNHPYAGAPLPLFDNQFLFPLINLSQGTRPGKILIPRPRITRLYEIAPNARGREGDPNLNEMAKEIVMKFSLASFKAEEVQKVIKSKWPLCEFAVYRPDTFSDLFYFQIWPLLCDERDAGRRLADKPEDDKYELSEAAIQQLRNRFGPTSEESA